MENQVRRINDLVIARFGRSVDGAHVSFTVDKRGEFALFVYATLHQGKSEHPCYKSELIHYDASSACSEVIGKIEDDIVKESTRMSSVFGGAEGLRTKIMAQQTADRTLEDKLRELTKGANSRGC